MKLRYRDPEIESLHEEINRDLELMNEVLAQGSEDVAKMMLWNIMELIFTMRMRSTALRMMALEKEDLTLALRANAARATTEGCIELVNELSSSSGLAIKMGVSINSLIENIAQA